MYRFAMWATLVFLACVACRGHRLKLKYETNELQTEFAQEGQIMSISLSELKANSTLSERFSPLHSLVRLLAVMDRGDQHHNLKPHGYDLAPSAMNGTMLDGWRGSDLPYAKVNMGTYNNDSLHVLDDVHVPDDVVGNPWGFRSKLPSHQIHPHGIANVRSDNHKAPTHDVYNIGLTPYRTHNGGEVNHLPHDVTTGIDDVVRKRWGFGSKLPFIRHDGGEVNHMPHDATTGADDHNAVVNDVYNIGLKPYLTHDVVEVNHALDDAEISLEKGELENPKKDPLFTFALTKILESVLEHVGNDLVRAGRRGENITNPFLKARISHFQVDHFDSKDISFHWKDDSVRFDIHDLELDLKLSLSKLRLFGIVPTLVNKLRGKDATLVVKVRGGVGIGFKRDHESGEWDPDVLIDGEGIDSPPDMDIKMSLDICKGLNCVFNAALPATVPFVKGGIKEEMAKALTKDPFVPAIKGLLKDLIAKALKSWSTIDSFGSKIMRRARRFK